MTSERPTVLVTADAVGGVWQYSLDLARGLTGLEYQVVLAVMGPAPSEEQLAATRTVPGLRVADTGTPLCWLADDAPALRAAAEQIAHLAAAAEADLVHLNTPALAALADFSAPVVAVQHSCVASWWEAVEGTALPQDFAWRTELVRQGLRAAAAVVTPTAAYGAAVQRIYGLERPPVTVHNGRTPISGVRAAEHDFVFTAGRLWDAAKNLATIDAAAARIAVPVHVAGPLRGPNGAEVVFNNLHCLGALGEEELGRWLAARPVFVSAALYEPFGLAVLEAAQAGCPLVLSDIPTFRELWDGAALFADPRDPAGYARIISDLVGDDFARRKLGHEAAARAERYTQTAMAAQMAALYRLLQPEAAGPALSARAA